jgi:Rrf2 family transcriptional regulator, iron-sulfur cluster assembly transcription factor
MLCLSQTTGYAVLALSCLADVGEGRWVLADSISKCTGIPRAYLSKILHSLGSSGLIRAKRGYRGGFALNRPVEQISVMDVALAVEGLAWLPKCLLGLSECSDERACPTHAFWSKECCKIQAELRQTTLKTVAEFEGAHGRRIAACLDTEGPEHTPERPAVKRRPGGKPG